MNEEELVAKLSQLRANVGEELARIDVQSESLHAALDQIEANLTAWESDVQEKIAAAVQVVEETSGEVVATVEEKAQALGDGLTEAGTALKEVLEEKTAEVLDQWETAVKTAEELVEGKVVDPVTENLDKVSETLGDWTEFAQQSIGTMLQPVAEIENSAGQVLDVVEAIKPVSDLVKEML